MVTKPKQATSAPSSHGPVDRTPISAALQIGNGARFYRCALQVNSQGYEEQFRGQPNALDKTAYIAAIIGKCVELGIEAIALTDHGSAANFEEFREVGERQRVAVFPGFELTSSDGVHVLCIYDLGTSAKTMERLLGALGVADTEPTSAPSKYSFKQILAKVRGQNGVTVAAHVTGKNGLFTKLSGQSCIDGWIDENLLAVQIPGTVDDVPNKNKWQSILKNEEPNYRREQMAGDDLAVAVINSCDVKEPSDLENAGASCWIKMSQISVEGLRQAFLDPDSRIRLTGDVSWENHAEIVAMTWEGGFLDGAAVHFNANLNVLIGGRGTGKSTVLESLRYALGIEPLGDDARLQHEGVVRSVLGNGTKVSVQICSYHPTRKIYRVERTVPNPPVVRDADGNLLRVTPSDVMSGTEIFGQHEIAELAKRPDKLTRVLHRFVPPEPQLAERIRQARRELQQSQTRILTTKMDLQRIDERLSQLPAIEETLKKFQEAGIETKLHDQALVVREERVLRTAVERMLPVREILAELRKTATIDIAFVGQKALDPLPAKAILEPLAPALRTLGADVLSAVGDLESALSRADTAIANIRSSWEHRRDAAQADYERILRELQRDKVNGGEFIRLREQIEELRPLAERWSQLLRIREVQEERRRSLVVEWEEVKSAEYRTLNAAAKQVNTALRGRVRVRVEPVGDRKPLADLLREVVGGTLAQTIKAMETETALSIPELATLCRGTPEALANRFKIPKAQAERLTGAGHELAMQIEELRLAPDTFAELNVAAEGDPEEWRVLDDLSSGQKATAVLLLLLLKSDGPLIVDQPEDDLDNRFISDGIVPTMRREKRKRQFIFTTHNANIPVLGDAELIVGLVTRSESGSIQAEMPVDKMGSIDNQVVRAMVEELLEGGKAAFEMRRRKYRF